MTRRIAHDRPARSVSALVAAWLVAVALTGGGVWLAVDSAGRQLSGSSAPRLPDGDGPRAAPGSSTSAPTGGPSSAASAGSSAATPATAAAGSSAGPSGVSSGIFSGGGGTRNPLTSAPPSAGAPPTSSAGPTGSPAGRDPGGRAAGSSPASGAGEAGSRGSGSSSPNRGGRGRSGSGALTDSVLTAGGEVTATCQGGAVRDYAVTPAQGWSWRLGQDEGPFTVLFSGARLLTIQVRCAGSGPSFQLNDGEPDHGDPDD